MKMIQKERAGAIHEIDASTVFHVLQFNDRAKYEKCIKSKWKDKYIDNIIHAYGNLITTNGKEEVIKNFMAYNNSQGGAGLFFTNTQAYVGVGNSSTAESASHTDLQGGSKLWKAMDTGFPADIGSPPPYAGTRWQSTFFEGEASFEWLEIGLANGPVPGSNDAIMFNRVVFGTPPGTKGASAIWVGQMDIS